MSQVKNYIKQHEKRYEEELKTWLQSPSISTLEENKKHVIESAEILKNYLHQAGLNNLRLIETKGNPLVYGERIINNTLPTILIYGHYDVQPIDPLNLWTHPPFSATIKNNKIYARGASDDKGQVFAHIKALELLNAMNLKLSYNIKMLIEGEEEIGSTSLMEFLKDENNLNLISSDIILVSDTSINSIKEPSISTSLRGIISLKVKITGPKRDLHSGLYGGAVANPIQTLCNLLSALKDKNNKITIPHFYDQVINLSPEERIKINKRFNLREYKQKIGINQVEGEAGYTTLERIGIRPALDINGIYSGYTKEGVKTVLPSSAHATLSIRLVPNQDPKKIAKKCEEYLKSLSPKSTQIEITIHPGSSKPVLVNTTSPAIKAACSAYKQIWGKAPTLTYEGGSIPILSNLQSTLKANLVLLGFGLESDNIHSPNEHFDLKRLYLSIETIITFYKKLEENNSIIKKGD